MSILNSSKSYSYTYSWYNLSQQEEPEIARNNRLRIYRAIVVVAQTTANITATCTGMVSVPFTFNTPYLLADGQDTTLVTVTLLDSTSAPATAQLVTLSTTEGTLLPVSGQGTPATTLIVTSDATGAASDILTSSVTPGAQTITDSFTDAGNCTHTDTAAVTLIKAGSSVSASVAMFEVHPQ